MGAGFGGAAAVSAGCDGGDSGVLVCHS